MQTDQLLSYLREELSLYFQNVEHSIKHKSFIFYNETAFKKENLYVNYIEQSDDIYLSNTLNCDISVREVNDVLKRFIDLKDSYEIVTVKKIINFNKEEIKGLEEKIFCLPEYSLKSAKDLLFVKEILLEYISKYALPFFSEIASVKDVNDKILEKVSFDEYSNYIPGNTALKVLIILKLCNKSKYNDYKIYLNNIISSQIKDPEYASYIDIINRQQKRIKLICEYLVGIE